MPRILTPEQWDKTRNRVARNWGELHEPRGGIMAHYDESGSDRGSIDYLLYDRRCLVSYNDVGLDNGDIVSICPAEKRAWHAGVCRPSSGYTYKDANSYFYGYAVAANHKEKATPAQVDAFVRYCVEKFTLHGWRDVRRIMGHNTEAWPRGRKDDPDGRLGKVLEVALVRRLVAAALT